MGNSYEYINRVLSSWKSKKDLKKDKKTYIIVNCLVLVNLCPL